MCSLKKPIIRVSNIKNSVRFLKKKNVIPCSFLSTKNVLVVCTVKDYMYSRYCPYFPKIVSLMWPKLPYISLFSKLKSDLAIYVSFMVLPYSLEKTPSGKGSVDFSKVYWRNPGIQEFPPLSQFQLNLIVKNELIVEILY